MRSIFTSLFTTNFFGVLNDNFLKTLACFIAIRWVSAENASFVVSAAAASLVLPYILLSPLAGRWAHIFSKKKVVVYSKIAEIPIMFIAILGFYLESVWVVIFSIFLMGTQSSLYSPAKYGLIRDVGGENNLPFGVGGFEAVSFFGMLSGTLLAAFLSESVDMITLYLLLVAFAVAGLVLSLTIKVREQYIGDDIPSSVNPITFIRNTHKEARKYKGLNTIIFGLSLFWWLVASLQIGLLVYCQMTLGLSPWQTGVVLSLAAVGITLGCLMAGVLQKDAFIFRWVAPSSFAVSFLLLVLFFVPLTPIAFSLVLFALSVLCGFFKVPLDTAIQKRAKGNFLPTVLAYFNQVSFIFILLASATLALISLFLPPKYLFLVLGLVFLIVPFYLMSGLKPVLCYFGRSIIHLRYDIKVSGLDRLSVDKTYLILPNHQAVADPVILFAEFYQYDMHPLVDELYFTSPFVGDVVRFFHGIPVPDLGLSRKGLSQTRSLESISLNALKGGQNIVLYPSGAITKDGLEHIGTKQLAYKLSQDLPQDAEVIGVRIQGLWGSIWSRYGRNTTPPLLPTLFKSLLTCLFVLVFKKRRVVTLDLYNITDEVKQWAQGDKIEFNKSLESLYNKGR
ncbi:MAG: MFS transporter [Rikenellaceae bacterium]